MSLLGPDRLLVGRDVVPRKEATCFHCHQPFKFGDKGAPGVNVYSRDGMREIGISGVCETCFDECCEEPDEDDWRADPHPYCVCDLQPTEDEEARNTCAACGKRLS